MHLRNDRQCNRCGSPRTNIDASRTVDSSFQLLCGITEFLKVAALARAAGVEVMPHSPYFGPGFLASLHLAAALPDGALMERFFLDLEASLYADLIDPVNGDFRLPEGPGLGMEPDPDVIERYRIRDA